MDAMDAMHAVDRRTFLTDVGRGTLALAVISVVGCGPSGQAGTSGSALRSALASTANPTPSGPSRGSADPSVDPSIATPDGDGEGDGDGEAVTWERVNLGFVSAYILVRGGEAAIVDTGVAGSAAAIEASLAGIGLDWTAVGHLILTHHHRDHVGSAADVLERAADAQGYAGAEDIPSITVPRALTAVADGDAVFGLRIITTPGHTAGSISVLDAAGGVLVAGDALRTDGGRPTLPGAQFSVDMTVAKESIVKLGGLTFETLLVGHGDPIERGASAAVAELGASA